MSADEEKKDGGANEQINIKVCGADGNEVFFKVKKSTTFQKIFKAYAERLGRPVSAFRFNYDGQRVNDTSTPADLDMDDNDMIDATVQQTGGIK